MAKYYNKTRSPVSAPLRDGSSGYFAPKQWVVVTKEQEGSSALVHLTKKGILIRREEKVSPSLPAPPVSPPRAPEPPKPPPPPPVVVEVSAPVPVAYVHVDVDIAGEESTIESDRTSPDDEVDENSVASEDETDTESKTSKSRSKSRGRR